MQFRRIEQQQVHLLLLDAAELHVAARCWYFYLPLDQAVLWIPDPMGGLPCLALVCGFYPVGSDCAVLRSVVLVVFESSVSTFDARCN
jgi:hypothetical protein